MAGGAVSAGRRVGPAAVRTGPASQHTGTGGLAGVYKALPAATYGGGEEAGTVAVDFPTADKKHASRHGPGVKTLSGGPH
jgi:hypothetical protein